MAAVGALVNGRVLAAAQWEYDLYVMVDRCDLGMGRDGTTCTPEIFVAWLVPGIRQAGCPNLGRVSWPVDPFIASMLSVQSFSLRTYYVKCL